MGNIEDRDNTLEKLIANGTITRRQAMETSSSFDTVVSTLHSILCKKHHNDECGYYTETAEGVLGSSTSEWRNIVHDLAGTFSIDTADTFLFVLQAAIEVTVNYTTAEKELTNLIAHPENLDSILLSYKNGNILCKPSSELESELSLSPLTNPEPFAGLPDDDSLEI